MNPPLFLSIVVFLVLGCGCGVREAGSTSSGESAANMADSTGRLPVDWHCLTDHLGEAIALNLERRPLYSALSAGRSEVVSESLIESERITLTIMQRLQPLLSYWHGRGIPIGCSEFVPMAETPAFTGQFAEPAPALGSVRWFNTFAGAVRLEKELLMGGLAAVAAQAKRELADLSAPQHFQCMTRHVLESIAKTAAVGREMHEQSVEDKIASPAWISRSLVHAQIVTLKISRDIDQAAAPLHAEGIPIVCNDVPHIAL